MITEAAYPFFDLFDRIYIVNLLGRPDRRDEMLEDLRLAGVPADVAVKWFYLSIPPDGLAGFPSLGAHGCFMSHLAILRDARKHGYKRILVMEDDLSFTDFFLDHQPEVVAALNETDWDFIHLGHVLTLRPRQHFKLIPADPKLLLQCTHFLAIRDTIIPDLVDFLEAILSRPPGHPDGGPMHVDGAFCTYRAANPGCRTFYAHPNLGGQRSSHSDVTPAFSFETYPGFNFLFTSMRRFKNKLRRKNR